MKVIVTAFAGFGLTVSAVNTEIIRERAYEMRGEDVVQPHCSRADTQTNARFCVFGRGYQRRQTTQCRDNAASTEGLVVLPAVQDENHENL